jgi:hypothetical protein
MRGAGSPGIFEVPTLAGAPGILASGGFYPAREPLSRDGTDVGEPIRRCNVLFPDRRPP